ncbi:hypothetical protein JMJ77_0001023 [Colletotrichum scovillei]|uniref:Uncharacterized protein n=1 Tax=Colletotrichum scovillei TaxID=1209932 RepID=A0A9P7UHW4_9PEZI|nr:hypothetical protein JMJ77_0001023 [Colletotrichum scovillei]KAG7072243.1 hypothetical protein JMJ76_0005099 [Colletotrichum scovillei]KAG7080355.1 hypothetical protein JMJ78_0007451 [Colletotrichum scovillei]
MTHHPRSSPHHLRYLSLRLLMPSPFSWTTLPNTLSQAWDGSAALSRQPPRRWSGGFAVEETESEQGDKLRTSSRGAEQTASRSLSAEVLLCKPWLYSVPVLLSFSLGVRSISIVPTGYAYCVCWCCNCCCCALKK